MAVDLVRTIPRSQIGPFYHRDDLTIGNGGKTYVAIDATRILLGPNEVSYLIESSCDPAFGWAIFDTLAMPDVPSDEEEFAMTVEQMEKYGKQFDRFEAGRCTVASVLANAVISVLPRSSAGSTTTMNWRIHQSRPDPSLRLVLPIMLRAGARFTFEAEKILRPHFLMPPKEVYLWTDRALDIMETKPIDLSLRGRHVVVFDPLNATGRTAVKGLLATIAACDSKWASITVCFAHGHKEGIEEIHRMFNGVTVFVGLLHKGMNEADYLTEPGFGDGGAKSAQVRDKH